MKAKAKPAPSPEQAWHACLVVPIRLPSAANLREHWAARARRVKAQRAAVALLWPWRGRVWRFPLTVYLTRQAPRPLDGDNCQGALKGVRDECARQLGVDDRDPRVRWEYGQARGTAAVLICVREDE